MAGGRISNKKRPADKQHEEYEIQRMILEAVKEIRIENEALGLVEAEALTIENLEQGVIG